MRIKITLEKLKFVLKSKSQEWMKWDEVFSHIIKKNYDDYFIYEPQILKSIDNKTI